MIVGKTVALMHYRMDWTGENLESGKLILNYLTVEAI